MGMSELCDLGGRNECVQRECWAVVGSDPSLKQLQMQSCHGNKHSVWGGARGRQEVPWEGALGQVCEHLAACCSGHCYCGLTGHGDTEGVNSIELEPGVQLPA